MAEFTPSKKTAQDFNNGVEYVSGDGEFTGDVVSAETINHLVESALYTQGNSDESLEVANNALEVANNALEVANEATYELPKANSNTLGGVQPVDKTSEMEQEVGVDVDGKLWTEPNKSLTEEEINSIINEVFFSPYVIPPKIYGVRWVNDTTTTMERTDDAVLMTYAINSSSGEIESDFNNVFPWTKAVKETDENGNVMLHMPEMWFRVDLDSDENICGVAVSEKEGTTGNWYHVDEFYYSCYGGYVENSKLYSQSGKTRTSSATRATFRTYATNMGAGYCQLDLYHKIVMTFLWWIEFATKKSDSIMSGRISGSGTGGGSSVCTCGGTDSVPTPSGFNPTTAQMRYHYIEDFVGNMYEWVDGATWNTNLYVTADPYLFSDSTTNLELWGKNGDRNKVQGSTLAFGWDDSQPFLIWSTKNNASDTSSFNTGFCDQCYNTDSSYSCVSSGAHYNYTYPNNGLSSFIRYSVSGTVTNVGGRLLRVKT